MNGYLESIVISTSGWDWYHYQGGDSSCSSGSGGVASAQQLAELGLGSKWWGGCPSEEMKVARDGARALVAGPWSEEQFFNFLTDHHDACLKVGWLPWPAFSSTGEQPLLAPQMAFSKRPASWEERHLCQYATASSRSLLTPFIQTEAPGQVLLWWWKRRTVNTDSASTTGCWTLWPRLTPSRYLTDDLLDQLGESKFFSALDLASGYWQIRVHPDSQEKTAFVMPQGLYDFHVMPFGLTKTPLRCSSNSCRECWRSWTQKMVRIMLQCTLMMCWSSHVAWRNILSTCAE